MRNFGVARVGLRSCAFETDRLLVREWHSLSPTEWERQELAPLVVELLTEPVTRSLPARWQGAYRVERAREWIAERDAEGATLLVVDRSARSPIGLLILFEARGDGPSAGTDVRLGYLLAEESWGRGFASELVAGFVDWCRRQDSISSITAGVAPDNPASARVLVKSGFQLLESSQEPRTCDQFYRLSLCSGSAL